MMTDLTRLVDSGYEEYMGRPADRFFARRLGLQTPRLDAWSKDSGRNLLSPVLDQVLDNGSIASNEEFLPACSEIVVSGKTQEGEEVYVTAEASYTVTGGDVTVVKRMAEILQRVSGVKTIPAIIGNDISDEAAAGAIEEESAFIRIEMAQQPAS